MNSTPFFGAGQLPGCPFAFQNCRACFSRLVHTNFINFSNYFKPPGIWPLGGPYSWWADMLRRGQLRCAAARSPPLGQGLWSPAAQNGRVVPVACPAGVVRLKKIVPLPNPHQPGTLLPPGTYTGLNGPAFGPARANRFPVRRGRHRADVLSAGPVTEHGLSLVAAFRGYRVGWGASPCNPPEARQKTPHGAPSGPGRISFARHPRILDHLPVVLGGVESGCPSAWRAFSLLTPPSRHLAGL